VSEPEPWQRIEPPAATPVQPESVAAAARPANTVEFADEIVEVRQPAKPKPKSAPDDLGQMSSGARALVFVGVLVGMVAIAWLVMTLVR